MMEEKIPGLGVIIVAGGSSTRYGTENKLFALLGGIPVFIHSLRNFAPLAEHLVLVVPESARHDFEIRLKEYLPGTAVKLTSGGANRTASVKNGLAALPGSTRIAAIHDAARPLAGAKLLRKLAERAQNRSCGAIAAEKMIDSVCRTDTNDVITENVPREDLWRIQTPQVFSYQTICSVYTQLGETSLTDDSAAARACGIPVEVINNPDPNLKLTTKSDLAMLEFFYKNALICKKTGKS